MAIEVKPDGRIYVRYRDPYNRKKHVSEYFGNINKDPLAKDKAKARNTALGFGKRVRSTDPTVNELSAKYFKQKQFNSNSKELFKIRYASNVGAFFGSRSATSLTDQDIIDYIAKRRSDPIYSYHTDPGKKKVLRYGVKWSTVRRELTDLKAILNWASEKKPPLIPFNPIARYKLPKPDYAIIDPPTLSEVRRVIAHAPEYLIRAIKLSFFLGLRPGAVELVSLDWDKVNFESEFIRVRSADKGGPPIRDVPIHPDLIAELKEWYVQDAQHGPIIHSEGRRVESNSVRGAWRKALRKAKITRRLRPYDLRHYFITQALREGKSIKAVAEVVGSQPNTIMHYYQHVTKREHREVVEVIPSLSSGEKDKDVIDIKRRS